MGYFEIYKKRVDRYGTDYQSRMQGEREHAFENYLHKSVYSTSFTYNAADHQCIFEPYKQDETETLHYLLTKVDLDIPNGVILELPDKNKVLKPWMIYWKEEYKASGYNRYIMLKMTHQIEWKGYDNQKHTTWAYLYGQENNMLKDELKSRSRSSVLYNENQKLNFFVAPANKYIQKEDYFKVSLGNDISQGFRVTGFDVLSTPGVEYISIDPMYIVDNTPAPAIPSDPGDEYFWLKSGEYYKTLSEDENEQG